MQPPSSGDTPELDPEIYMPGAWIEDWLPIILPTAATVSLLSTQKQELSSGAQ